MIAALFAQNQPPPGGGGLFGDPNTFLLWMIALMVLFWVVVLMPMSRRQRREQAAMLAGLKRGSKVLTNSGIVGTVVSVKDNDDEIVIRSEDARLRIKRSTVLQVLGSDESEAAK
jgi:preprotein translocase subunit YajC